jgi:hypothetical protein
VAGGGVSSVGGETFVFTPTAPLAPGTYTTTAFNVEATTPMRTPFTWSFTVE